MCSPLSQRSNSDNNSMLTESEPLPKQLRLQELPRFLLQGEPPPGAVPVSSPTCQTDGWPHQVNVPVDLTAHLNPGKSFSARKQREFIPDSKKDAIYWDRRRRNNEAAKRSRQKRRINDLVLETQILELTKENAILRAELGAIKDKYEILPQQMINSEQISLPVSSSPPELCERHVKPMPTIVPNICQTMGSTTTSYTHSPNISISSLSLLSFQPISHPSQMGQVPIVMTSSNDSGYSTSGSNSLSSIQSNSSTELKVSSCPTLEDTLPIASPVVRSSPVDQESTGSSSCCSSTEDSPQTSASGHSSPHFSLPHKLRHKTRLGERELHQNSPSPTDNGRSSRQDIGLSSRQDIREDTSSVSSDWDSTGSNDNPSSVSLSSADTNCKHRSPRKSSHKTPSHDRQLLQAENSQLRSELQRLATEVASLRTLILKNRSFKEFDDQPSKEKEQICSDYQHNMT
ncbi:nuclear factor interleukin-3-regulated protein-like isoform X2 [Limulus polyphemus]|uniref:Nuclear factor interleukin-3-regulated protein-like isoform X2 n=1 Tax=Limulus polyphemus TaxID=6850 RepID=A0ABM1SCD8_LIMPO|nr:nuclear factor interleukin-3-regulated protein-like isoform X2 [Limulus polyphemus]